MHAAARTQPTRPTPSGLGARGWRMLRWAVVVAACVGVFMLYQRPDFLVMMADMAWSCF